MQDEHPWQAQQAENPRLEAEAGGVDGVGLDDTPAEKMGSTRWIALFLLVIFALTLLLGAWDLFQTPSSIPTELTPTLDGRDGWVHF